MQVYTKPHTSLINLNSNPTCTEHQGNIPQTYSPRGIKSKGVAWPEIKKKQKFMKSNNLFQMLQIYCLPFCNLHHKDSEYTSTAYIRARLVEWVYKPWLLLRKCFPNERLVYDIQHLPTYIHLQAMAFKRGWLKCESALSNEPFSRQK